MSRVRTPSPAPAFACAYCGAKAGASAVALAKEDPCDFGPLSGSALVSSAGFGVPPKRTLICVFHRRRTRNVPSFPFLLGSTGCQPVVAGSLPATLLAHVISKESVAAWGSASCRALQAGSLRSPETHDGARNAKCGKPPFKVREAETSSPGTRDECATREVPDSDVRPIAILCAKSRQG